MANNHLARNAIIFVLVAAGLIGTGLVIRAKAFPGNGNGNGGGNGTCCVDCNIFTPDPCCFDRIKITLDQVVQEGGGHIVKMAYKNDSCDDRNLVLAMQVTDPDNIVYSIQFRELFVRAGQTQNFEWRIILVPKKGTYVFKFNAFQNDLITPMAKQRTVSVNVN